MDIYTASSLSAKNKPQILIVLLHGYGADGANLIDLGQVWTKKFSFIDCIAPNAPFPCEQGMGYQWATIRGHIDKMAEDIQPVFSKLQVYLDQELNKRQLTYKNLILMGFSQGAYLALHMGLFLANQNHFCAGIMGYAGWITVPKTPILASHFQKKFPPVLLVHGSADTIVPLQGSINARDLFNQFSENVKFHICKNLGHSINLEGIQQGEIFINHILSNLNILESILADEIL